MTSYADPEQRIQFLQLHKKVIQEHQLSVMVNDSISRQRKFIDQTIKKLISSLRSFCFLNTWYPRISMSDITLFLQSSIYHHEKNQIVDNPSSLPYQTNITISINTFLRSIHNYMNSFLKCVVVYFDSPRPDIVFNPCDKPLSFFASSTFPSLFGYCWCVEQGISYVEALIQLLEIQTSNYSINSSEFRNSFIRDIIRQFLHMSEVQNYLRMALFTDY
ncbi:hypothetical protein TRFO_30089 [Tritrichomonas foetus]|uniref:Uncharacterized protein n=1 Tax=Tritrichomonas foetus TaxID=1144522 RepID=A0A1J4JYW6_9EUKA|nr:hypothetical protein TRFO_30089 [Tritrichomonas foetus]|eukprot:OHT02724.1 hypothetical protein TRFO_30089 [Tritrichomonas foetus]